MIARLCRYLLLFQGLTGLGLFYVLHVAHQAWHISNPWLAGASAAGMLLLLRLLITANNFLLAWIHGSPTPPRYRLTLLQSVRLFTEEYLATMVSASWSMPFRTFSARLYPDSTSMPVLLIHGYACNSGYWNSMSQALGSAQISHRALDLEPIGASIDDYAPLIERAAATLRQESGSDKIIVLAHSMGGLAARAWLATVDQAHLAGVITLGTPHAGTVLANFGPGINSRQMARQGQPSAWLRALAARETPALRKLFVSIYSHHDNIIAPQSASHLPQARNIRFGGIGHVALARNVRIQARVIREIRRLSKPFA